MNLSKETKKEVDNMKVRLASDIQSDSILDGEGIRTVIWFQGCLHNCPGCHNPETHDLNGGEEYDTEEIIEKIKGLKYQQGITLSGGDPFFQASAAIEFAKCAHEKKMNVWAYTGFTYDYLIDKGTPEQKELLNNVDVLVDGRFILEQKSYECKFRGSKNQRVIDVPKSLDAKKVVLYYED